MHPVDGIVSVSQGRFVVSEYTETVSLRVSNTRESDEGEYKCVFSEYWGEGGRVERGNEGGEGGEGGEGEKEEKGRGEKLRERRRELVLDNW